MKTQTDLVNEQKGLKEKLSTKKVIVPGIETLHTKSAADVAEVVSLILRSQTGIKEFKYVIGEYFELTYEP